MSLSVATEGQQTFDGMDKTTKVKFVGVQYDSLRGDFQLGEEVEFKVRGRVVGTGDEEMNDGHVRHVVKVDVQAVSPTSYDEPEIGDGVTVIEGDGLFSDQDGGE